MYLVYASPFTYTSHIIRKHTHMLSLYIYIYIFVYVNQPKHTTNTKTQPTTGGPPGIAMSPRMNPPRGPGMGPMGPGSYGGAGGGGGGGGGMRGPPPNSSLGPGGPGGMPPGMGLAGGPRQWQPNASTPMNYAGSSPGNYGVSLVNVTGLLLILYFRRLSIFSLLPYFSNILLLVPGSKKIIERKLG